MKKHFEYNIKDYPQFFHFPLPNPYNHTVIIEYANLKFASCNYVEPVVKLQSANWILTLVNDWQMMKKDLAERKINPEIDLDEIVQILQDDDCIESWNLE